MKTRWMVGGMLGALASAQAVLAGGFPEARDEEAKFHVRKKVKTWIKLESKAPGETIKGNIKEFSGQLKLNPAKLDSASGKFTVPLKNLDTANKVRNQHMLSSDWMEADKYPDVEFTVESIEGAKLEKKSVDARLKGKMKIHGVEKDVSIPVRMVYVKDKKADGKADTLDIRGEFEIKLADYEIKGKPGAVGTKVANTMKMSVSAHMGVGEVEEKAKATKPPPKSL